MQSIWRLVAFVIIVSVFHRNQLKLTFRQKDQDLYLGIACVFTERREETIYFGKERIPTHQPKSSPYLFLGKMMQPT